MVKARASLCLRDGTFQGSLGKIKHPVRKSFFFSAFAVLFLPSFCKTILAEQSRGVGNSGTKVGGNKFDSLLL